MAEAAETQAVTVIEQGSAPAPSVMPESGTGALMRLIERAALDPTFDVAKLDHLLAVKERWEANEAKKAFLEAKAAFKAEAPKIDKNKQVAFDSQRGGARTEYRHATLDHIEELISPVLSKHGLTYSWTPVQGDGGMIAVTCTLTHVLGHSEAVTLKASPDQSGNKNNIQAVGSTVTFLSRYTLLSVTGLSTGEMDDDGETGGDPANGEFINANQKTVLIDLMKITKSDTARFLKYMGVATLDEIKAGDFPKAKQALDAKKAGK